jgi:hypothetical protein
VHDQNFKNLILDYPLQALQFFAKHEAALLDESVKITPIRQEQLKTRLGNNFRELDCPLLAEWPDGRREALLFALEEETNPRNFDIHRLAHYCLDLAALYETDRVVPVVVFLHNGQYAQQLTLGSEHCDYLAFQFISCHLAVLDYAQYRNSNNLVERLNLPNMRYPPGQKIDVYAQAVKGLFTLETDTNKQAKYLDFIDIYTDLNDNELQQYRESYPEEVNKMIAFAERFRNEGLEQGLEKGEVSASQKLLLNLLRLKFGDSAITQNMRSKIEQADYETLLRWSSNVLNATSIEKVFNK